MDRGRDKGGGQRKRQRNKQTDASKTDRHTETKICKRPCSKKRKKRRDRKEREMSNAKLRQKERNSRKKRVVRHYDNHHSGVVMEYVRCNCLLLSFNRDTYFTLSTHFFMLCEGGCLRR